MDALAPARAFLARRCAPADTTMPQIRLYKDQFDADRLSAHTEAAPEQP